MQEAFTFREPITRHKNRQKFFSNDISIRNDLFQNKKKLLKFAKKHMIGQLKMVLLKNKSSILPS